MTARPHTLLVCRPHRTPAVQELDAAATHFLSAADGETRLGHAARQSATRDDAAHGRIIAIALEHRLLAIPVTR